MICWKIDDFIINKFLLLLHYMKHIDSKLLLVSSAKGHRGRKNVVTSVTYMYLARPLCFWDVKLVSQTIRIKEISIESEICSLCINQRNYFERTNPLKQIFHLKKIPTNSAIILNKHPFSISTPLPLFSHFLR